MLKIYVAVNYQTHDNHRINLAFLRKQDAQDCVDEGYAKKVIEIESEELEWMKRAADGACQFQEDAEMGRLEMSTLYGNIKEYEQEIYYR